jgi:hypothetical protein
MKPLKSGLTLVNWLFRIALLLFVVLIFIDSFKTFNFGKRQFYISAVFIVFATMLFIGGFLSKSSLTVISGLVLTLISFVIIFFNFSGRLDIAIANYLIILAIGFYFLCTGN